MKELQKSTILLIIIALLTSCSRKIYTYSDIDGTSKFIVYKNNYKYIENSKFGKFSETGTYELNDSLISFVYKNKEKIPYTYQSNHIQIRSKRINDHFQIIHLTDKDFKSPIPFTSILFKDKTGKIINATESDMDGVGIIKNNNDIYQVEIGYVGFSKQVFLYDKYLAYDLDIQLEQPKRGGRMSSGCLIDYIDLILEYKIDDPSDICKLERNGIVYVKQINMPKKK